MAITLRYTTTDTSGKASELSYQEMNNNLKSYFYSSSLNGEVLNLFYLTGSLSQSIDLSTFVTQLESGSLLRNSQTGSFYYSSSVNLNTITFYQGDGTTETVTVDTGSSVAGATIDTGSFYYSSSVSRNTIIFFQGDGTTETVTVDTGSGGGSASPGGSDTYVQFNDGGSTFGGDSGFTYNKTANRVTITAPSSPTRTAPNLLLNSELSNVTAGEVLGVIAANNATDQYNPANYPASIQFVADTNFTPGIYDTSIRLYTNDGATEKEALRLINTGQAKLPQYGSGTFTGTNAYYLAVSASGEVIETDITAGPDLSQPSAVTHTFNGDISNSANYAWEVEVGSATSAPSGAGKMRVGHSSPGNRNTSIFTAISFHRTSSNATDASSVLDYLCEGGTMAFRTTGGSLVADTLIIKEVDNSNANYVIVYVSITSGTNADIATSTTYRMDFQSDALIPLLDQNYNRVTLNNLASGTPAVVLVPPSTAAIGDYYLVEITAGSSNAGAFAVNYPNYITGATTTYDINRTAARYLAGTNTVTPITLDYSSYGQAAILHLRVHKVAGAQPSFALIGADKVLS